METRYQNNVQVKNHPIRMFVGLSIAFGLLDLTGCSHAEPPRPPIPAVSATEIPPPVLPSPTTTPTIIPTPTDASRTSQLFSEQNASILTDPQDRHIYSANKELLRRPPPPEQPVKKEVLPRPPQVEPNDILGRKYLTEPTVLFDETKVDAGTLVAVILKPGQSPIYLNIDDAREYFERGAVFPYWLSSDGKTIFVISDDGSEIRAGPLDKPKSTYILIRHYDLKKGAFSSPPAVSIFGWIAVVKDRRIIDTAEAKPHHGGSTWKVPSGWKIISLGGFGVGPLRRNLLVYLHDENGLPRTEWLVNYLTSIPEHIQKNCGNSTNGILTDCAMKVIRNEDGKQRPPGEGIVEQSVPESDGVFDPVIISRDYP